MKPTSILRTFVAIFILTSILSIRSAYGYLLPDYSILTEDWNIPAEKLLNRYSVELKSIGLNNTKLLNYEQNRKIKLTTKEKKELPQFRKLSDAVRFWNFVVELKKSLIKLHGAKSSDAITAEADQLSKSIIERIYAISQEYRVKFTALFQNYLVNSGSKKKGHCYHYVHDLRKMVWKKNWNHFTFHWGVSHQGDFLENNSLVITSMDGKFEDGIAIDSWRTAGIPFWIEVTKDEYKWKERFDVEIE